MGLVVLTVLFIGCSPESEKNIPQNESSTLQTGEVKPVEESKEGEDSAKTIVSEEGTSLKIIKIYAKLFTEHTKGPVMFTHDKHNKEYNIACNDCHHVYENGKNIWKEGMKVDKCEVCHNEATVKREKTLPPDLQKKNLKLAFHNNCRMCHRKIKRENPESKAPTTCSGCHEKIK
jgi:hypothetical protein